MLEAADTRGRLAQLLPSPTVFGTNNLSHGALLGRRKLVEILARRPPAESHIPRPLFEERLDDMGYIERLAAFDPQQSPELALDGKETSGPFTPAALAKI